jgi:hypothetical protein
MLDVLGFRVAVEVFFNLCLAEESIEVSSEFLEVDFGSAASHLLLNSWVYF